MKLRLKPILARLKNETEIDEDEIDPISMADHSAEAVDEGFCLVYEGQVLCEDCLIDSLRQCLRIHADPMLVRQDLARVRERAQPSQRHSNFLTRLELALGIYRAQSIRT